MHKVLGVISLGITLISLIMQFSDSGSSRSDFKALSLDHLKPQHKYWMLEAYMDTILEYKSIVKNSQDPVVQNAIFLRIEEDTFYTTGLLHSARSKKVATNVLGPLEGNAKINFVVEIMGHRIMATTRENGERKMYNYAPITEDEYQLLIHTEDAHPSQQGVNNLLADRLFTGNYKSLDGKSKDMTLNADGSVVGFKRFSKFRVHDYFGTSHPFGGLDVIWFEPENQKGNYYNWKFASDTLILTEMLTKDKETYFPGKKSVVFLKSI